MVVGVAVVVGANVVVGGRVVVVGPHGAAAHAASVAYGPLTSDHPVPGFAPKQLNVPVAACCQHPIAGAPHGAAVHAAAVAYGPALILYPAPGDALPHEYELPFVQQ